MVAFQCREAPKSKQLGSSCHVAILNYSSALRLLWHLRSLQMVTRLLPLQGF
jgi:hypothetical protein